MKFFTVWPVTNKDMLTLLLCVIFYCCYIIAYIHTFCMTSLALEKACGYLSTNELWRRNLFKSCWLKVVHVMAWGQYYYWRFAKSISRLCHRSIITSWKISTDTYTLPQYVPNKTQTVYNRWGVWMQVMPPYLTPPPGHHPPMEA